MSEDDHDASIIRRPWPTRRCRTMQMKLRKKSFQICIKYPDISVLENFYCFEVNVKIS